jgi:peroxiredoxin
VSPATRQPRGAAIGPAAQQEIAARLAGAGLPGLAFDATSGVRIHLRELAAQELVLYVYPRTGRPGFRDPPGWDTIPGARGCTAQACAFRDLSPQFDADGVLIAGLSAQPAGDQREAAARLRLPFPLLADPRLRLAAALGLPTFRAGRLRLCCRLTLIARSGVIVKALYPVDDPGQHAGEVLAWLRETA